MICGDIARLEGVTPAAVSHLVTRKLEFGCYSLTAAPGRSHRERIQLTALVTSGKPGGDRLTTHQCLVSSVGDSLLYMLRIEARRTD